MAAVLACAGVLSACDPLYSLAIRNESADTATARLMFNGGIMYDFLVPPNTAGLIEDGMGGNFTVEVQLLSPDTCKAVSTVDTTAGYDLFVVDASGRLSVGPLDQKEAGIDPRAPTFARRTSASAGSTRRLPPERRRPRAESSTRMCWPATTGSSTGPGRSFTG